MESIPPGEWWIVIGGVLWSTFWVTVVYLLIWAVAHLRVGLDGLERALCSLPSTCTRAGRPDASSFIGPAGISGTRPPRAAGE
ncbi:MAG: hypothetical protein A2Y74_02260 [Actinobacteria bacterium RBG_13_63_9]|nr:MAG: hypothetical protein A2Y74_02260 [Actinobacteria bacterium RBG_13_63_9]